MTHTHWASAWCQALCWVHHAQLLFVILSSAVHNLFQLSREDLRLREADRLA